MQGQIREQWEELCKQAVSEKDPKKLLEIYTEINRLLTEVEQRLPSQRVPTTQVGPVSNSGLKK